MTARLFPKLNKSKMSSRILPTKSSFKLQGILWTAGAHRCQHFTASLPTTDSLLEMFARGKPTSKKIISLFDANPKTKAQGEALSYLKRYVRGMEDEKLTKFLRFCTGSNMVCVEKITINFNNLEGAERRPVAHTCGAVLDLPATYPSFPLFRGEWNSILSSEYWDIDFV